jgi:hypothetical protein
MSAGTNILRIDKTSMSNVNNFTALSSDFGKWEREFLRDYPISKEHYELGNSTVLPEDPGDIRQEIEALFILGKGEVFEDGMESKFSRRLVSIIRRYGRAAIEEITYPIFHEEVDSEAAAEALIWLGYIDHAPTYNHRLRLLEQSLGCSSVQVRDGAALGLAYLDDPDAISCLEQAIQQEQCEELREDMKQVLKQLLETSASAPHSEKDKEI